MEQIKLDKHLAALLIRQIIEVSQLQENQAHNQELVFTTESLKNIAATLASLKQAGISHLDNEEIEKLIHSLQLESLLQG